MDSERYGFQGGLQTELTEKIKIGLDNLTESKRAMFADDIFNLISIAMAESHTSKEDRWELINSRAGQYLNSYVPKGGDYPEHVTRELKLIRGDLT